MPDTYDHVRKFPLNVVLAALGFETFKYRKSGTEGYGACPIHGSKKNTTCFSFNDDGKWNCFSCGKHGKGSIDLTMAVKACGFQQAVEWLKALHPAPETALKNVQVPQPDQEIPSAAKTSLTENPPFKATYDKYKVESHWLKERGFTQETLDKFEVFQYHNPARKSAYSGSVMLKIRRWSDGECVGYLSRNVGEITPERPKYVFPKGLQKSLEVFGAVQIKNAHEGALRLAYLLESPFAVMKFSQLGFPAVSTFGWSASPEQVAILAKTAKGLVYLPDRNKVEDATRIAGILSRQVWVKMPQMPSGVSDPEQLSVEQIRALMT